MKHAAWTLIALTLALTACGEMPEKKDNCDETCETLREVDRRNDAREGLGSLPHLCTGSLPACYWRVNPRGDELEIECATVTESTLDGSKVQETCGVEIPN